MKKAGAVFVMVVLATLLGASEGSACTVCYGAADDSMTRGMNNGILTLLSVVGIVQLGFVAMFVSFWRRGKKRRAQRERMELIDGGAR